MGYLYRKLSPQRLPLTDRSTTEVGNLRDTGNSQVKCTALANFQVSKPKTCNAHNNRRVYSSVVLIHHSLINVSYASLLLLTGLDFPLK